MSHVIPHIGELKKLSINDKDTLDAIVTAHLPYSDFNVFSLICYNTENDHEYTIFDDALIIKMRDYLTNEEFYTFLGGNNTSAMVDALLSRSKELNFLPHLQLIPESNYKSLAENPNVSIIEDRDNFDYVLSTAEIATLSGAKFNNKRHQVNNFKRNHPTFHINKLDFSSDQTKDDLLSIFFAWGEGKNKDSELLEFESKPIRNMLKYHSYFNLVTVDVSIANERIAFAVAEPVSSEYAVFHFVKSKPGYKGIFDLLYHEICKELYKIGIPYLNIEQDFGFEGLRLNKMQWNPTSFLKKYRISYLQEQ